MSYKHSPGCCQNEFERMVAGTLGCRDLCRLKELKIELRRLELNETTKLTIEPKFDLDLLNIQPSDSFEIAVCGSDTIDGIKQKICNVYQSKHSIVIVYWLRLCDILQKRDQQWLQNGILQYSNRKPNRIRLTLSNGLCCVYSIHRFDFCIFNP
eukprot:378836_1